MSKSVQNPRVGIWWLVGKTLVAFTEELDQVRLVHGVWDTDLAHVKVWPQVVGRYPKLRGKEYESIPRGRVVRHGTMFHILVPNALAGDRQAVEKILIRFKLRSQRCRVVADEHYDPPEMIDWDD